MKIPSRIYYSEAHKALMWDRWPNVLRRSVESAPESGRSYWSIAEKLRVHFRLIADIRIATRTSLLQER